MKIKKGVLIKGKNKKTVNIPKRVTVIEEGAFRDCNEIEEIIFPAGLKCIKLEAFSGCKALRKVRIPDGVTIEEAVFKNCTSLENVILPSDLNFVACHLFKGCISLKKVKIPDNVIEIGEGAFEECELLEKVILPNSLKSIGSYVFLNCKLLNNLKLPEDLKIIGDKAFQNCSSLQEITIPNDISDLESGIFFGCENLKKIKIPKTVTKIGEAAFGYCTNLECLTLPKSLRFIGDKAFERCESLQEITIPNGISTLGEAVFAYCKKLKKIIIPSSVIEIGKDAFRHCISLHHITLPNNLKVIEHNLFAYCNSLESITLLSDIIIIGPFAFNSCTSLKNLNLKSGLKYIGHNAFYNCHNLSLNIETSLFDYDFASDNNYTFNHSSEIFSTFDVKDLTINGEIINLCDVDNHIDDDYVYSIINELRKKEFLDKIKIELSKSNIKLLNIDYIFAAFIEKIIFKFNKSYLLFKKFNSYYDYRDDFSKFIQSKINNASEFKPDTTSSQLSIDYESSQGNYNSQQNVKFIQIIYNEKLYSIPLDFDILFCIKQQDDVEITFENNYIVRDDANNGRTFKINDALRKAYLISFSRLDISEELKEYLKRYEEYTEYRDITSIISVKAMVNELAYIYYLETKDNNIDLLQDPFNKIRLGKGLNKFIKR